MKLNPPFYLFLFIVLTILLYLIYPNPKILNYPSNLLGFIPLSAGAILNIWAGFYFAKEKTTINPYGKPSSLLENGPFRISRNPMYLGMLCILLGLSLFLGTALSFLTPIFLFIVLNDIFIPREEKRLKEVFGEKYLKYKQRVKRWL